MSKLRKREIWNDKNTKEMLYIIKNHYAQLFDSKVKRNQPIFQKISLDLRSKGVHKSAEQIRSKFKSLKSDFLKLKRNNSEKPAGRQACDLFDILNDVLGNQCVPIAEGTESSHDESDVEENEYDLKREISELLDSNPNYISEDHETFEVVNEVLSRPALASEKNKASTNYFELEENSDDIEGDPLETTSNNEIPYKRQQTENHSDEEKLSPPSKIMRTFKQTKSNSYVKVVQSFTTEWKNTQENMLLQMKEQDKQYLECLQEMLEINRTETAKILEEDRKETQKMLNKFIGMMQPQSQQSWQPQLNISRPVVNFNINNPSTTSMLPQTDVVQDTTLS